MLLKGGEDMKKWIAPALDVLEVKYTLAGPGLRLPDEENDDPDEPEADHYS